jgi:predicted RNA-binding protein with RPS1 domain
VEDDGHVNVASADEAAANKAIGMIQELTATAELNKTYLGKVQRITDFGAFVEIMPGTDGLLHVSEIAHYRVKDVRDELKEGQQVLVKVINIDPTGKIRLSRKALITPEEAARRPRATARTARALRLEPAAVAIVVNAATAARVAIEARAGNSHALPDDCAAADGGGAIVRSGTSPEPSRIHDRREGPHLHSRPSRCLAG